MSHFGTMGMCAVFGRVKSLMVGIFLRHDNCRRFEV